MNLRADKLDMRGLARAMELENADPERLAWHVACVERDNERLMDLKDIVTAKLGNAIAMHLAVSAWVKRNIALASRQRKEEK